jgi:hypothetical protein
MILCFGCFIEVYPVNYDGNGDEYEEIGYGTCQRCGGGPFTLYVEVMPPIGSSGTV